MGRGWLRFTAAFAAVLLCVCACLAEDPPDEKDYGIIDSKETGLAKDIVYRFLRVGDADFVLVGLEGSGMNPRNEDSGITWNEGLQGYNVIDFTIANELSDWDDERRAEANEAYSAAVVDAVLEKYGRVRCAGVFAFSKGACGADSVFRRLREKGIQVAFVWLGDPFTAHEMPAIMEAVENSDIMLYNRYSKKERLRVYAKEIEKTYGDRPNVDSRFIRTSHGGLLVYDTFTEELTGAIEMAVTVTDPALFLVVDDE